MSKVLITGCAGFIGSHLVDRLLEEGNEVIGIDCFTDYYPPNLKRANIALVGQKPGFTLIERDIVNVEHFPSVDHVSHTARNRAFVLRGEPISRRI